MSKEKESIRLNVKENWGGLVNPEGHTAAIGARWCDSRRREFLRFADRTTVIGDRDVLRQLEKWLLSNKTLKAIRCNTKFSYGIDDMNSWSTDAVIGKDIAVSLFVRCSGEYCYVRAYADRIPSGTLRVLPIVDDRGNQCWHAFMDGRNIVGPHIYAESRLKAMNMLLDFVANELEARDHLE